MKIAIVHDGLVVHGGAGHMLAHTVGRIARADACSLVEFLQDDARLRGCEARTSFIRTLSRPLSCCIAGSGCRHTRFNIGPSRFAAKWCAQVARAGWRRCSTNAPRAAGRLITGCNGRASGRHTIRRCGGARDYAARAMRCRSFPGISVKTVGNEQCQSS